MLGETEPRAQQQEASEEDYELPTRDAHVTLQKQSTKAEVVVPGVHAPGMLQMATFAVCAIGVVIGPVLTLRTVPLESIHQDVAFVLLGQLLALIAITLAAYAARKAETGKG